jgi:hypothetical protein
MIMSTTCPACLLLVDLRIDSWALQIPGDLGILAMSGDQRWRAA